MPLIWRLCGALPSRQSTRHAFAIARPFRARLEASTDDILIPRWNIWLRDQQSFGSCVGQALAGCVETQVGDAQRLSGVSIWREARRQQGEIEDIESGTRVEYGVSAVHGRGYSDPWRDGEDSDSEEAGWAAPDAGDDLADELAAHDTHGRVIYHSLIISYGNSLHDDLGSALHEGLGVVIATGTRDPFYSLAADEVATARHLGGNSGGHAMLIVGRRSNDGALEYLVRNSWGPSWGGASVADTMSPGLFWCAGTAIAAAWELHVVRVN